MPTEILMPALSPTMKEGNLTKWTVKEGDTISAGQVICEIETDKATMEVEAVDEGVLGKIIVPAGSASVAVNSLIALLLDDGEDAAGLDGYVAAPAKPAAATPAAPAAPAPAAAAPAPAAKPTGGRVFASPLARRIAKDKGLDLNAISGSGPHGRIVKRDVENAKPSAAPAAAPRGTAAPLTLPASGSYTEIPHSQMRKIIATRLQESKQTVPHFYLTAECRIDKLLAMRAAMNAASPEGDGAWKISVNDFVVKAVAKALVDVPAANAMWTDTAILQFNTVDISVAVATPNGLITPIVRYADTKGLAAISAEVKGLAKRARDGKLMPEDYTGGGFTISNLGMYGVKDFAAIINPPQSCILAVGAGEQRPVVEDGQLAVGTVMNCTLSVDHRSVDGAVGAQFLAQFKRYVEEPALLAL
ncbi:MAG: pyruvate dehydrogenase complex dihydrolipoamide acetyltransferase [Alphaproteobacteria bacterium]|nr:pyruvate dehydrogenase complex dihydrolipoamide acetyltransferase [Alphaproteobacteria bacterium]